MNKILFIILISIAHISFAQETKYCVLEWCKLPKNHKAHFDPYYNGHLCENFDSKQADFSTEYFHLQTKEISKISIDKTDQLAGYTFDISNLFNTGEFHQNGVIGTEYSRIKIHISNTERINNKHEFIITGKSNVSGNICDFRGKLEILKIFEITVNPDFEGQASLFAKYEFLEDSTQNHVGIFKGTFECSVKIDHYAKTIKLDKSFIDADGYYNRSYVGTWTGYEDKTTKKCIWGDYRLPFTFDFDGGDGEMMINDKYINNGWKSFSNGSEYDYSSGNPELINKWWK